MKQAINKGDTNDNFVGFSFLTKKQKTKNNIAQQWKELRKINRFWGKLQMTHLEAFLCSHVARIIGLTREATVRLIFPMLWLRMYELSIRRTP